ncbi:MAG: AEC family transporter [Anaerolineales bacterium]
MTGLLNLFAENVLPVLLLAATGFALQRALRIDPRPLAQVVFHAFAPALVFRLLLQTSIGATDILRMMGLAGLVMGGIGILSWALARAFRLPPPLTAAFVLTSTFMNAGNFGLSVNQLAFGEQALAWAVLFFTASSVLANSVGVYLASVGKASPRIALLGLLRVPSLYAIPLALGLRSLSWDLPEPLQHSVDLLAAAAIPAMLLLLGMHIGQAGLPRQQRGPLAGSVFLRLVVSPIWAWILLPLFHLPRAGEQSAILEAAMPTAVLTSVIASEYQVEPEFVAGAVLVSTLLSPLTVTPLILLLGG